MDSIDRAFEANAHRADVDRDYGLPLARPARTATGPDAAGIETFTVRQLGVLAYVQGFTLHHYKASSLDAAMSSGFFDEAADILAVGDMVLISARDGGAAMFVASTKFPVVLAPIAGGGA